MHLDDKRMFSWYLCVVVWLHPINNVKATCERSSHVRYLRRKEGRLQQVSRWQVRWICVCQQGKKFISLMLQKENPLGRPNNKSSATQKNAFKIPVHASSSARTHRKNEYELLMVISIKKKATHTYPTSRQRTISAFVQGTPSFSWMIR